MTRWLTNPFTGPLLELAPVPPRPHDPEVALWGGRLTPLAPGQGPRLVSGAGWEAEGARGACVGEALERWDPRPAAQDRLLRASVAAWPLAAEPPLDPATWVGFHPEQYAQPGFPFRPFTPARELDWVAFRRAPEGTPTWVPAALAYLEPGGVGAGHELGPGISTGLVAGRRHDPLVLRGLQEVLERDAVVGAWWRAYALEELDADEVFAALGAARARRLRRPNLTWRFYRVEAPTSAHVTLATLAGEDLEGFVFSVGSACRSTRSESLGKAALEAVQGRSYARWLRGQHQVAPAPPLPDFPEHAVYYSLAPERLAETPLEGAPAASPGSATSGAAEDLAGLLERLGPSRPVLYRDMTPPGLGASLPGLAVLRVLVPGLQPLWGDDRIPPLGGPLWAGRELADFPALPPHPFP